MNDDLLHLRRFWAFICSLFQRDTLELATARGYDCAMRNLDAQVNEEDRCLRALHLYRISSGTYGDGPLEKAFDRGVRQALAERGYEDEY